MITIDQIERWLNAREDEHVEFKEAKTSFSFDALVDYCAAIANEGGGHVVLGVSPKLPRKVVGSRAFPNLPGTLEGLHQRLHLHVHADRVDHPAGPVLVFSVPSRPVGVPIHIGGRYLTRVGASLTAMTPGQLARVFAETTPDYSAETCKEASVTDLDPAALDTFRKQWAKKSNTPGIEHLADQQLLTDAELALDGQVTYAALVLFGTRQALGRWLPQAEVVFEYRSTEATGPAQQRLDFRRGFFSCFNDLWNAIAARNELQHYQDGLFIWDVPTFQEAVVREAVLNAVAHRDYRLQGSVFVRQYPRKLEIVSPGGLPPGITVDNILWKQSPRNRRICEAFQRCGLVERSGQGMNRIYETCIRSSQPLPDFRGTDEYQVSLTLSGLVEDPRFVAMLERVGQETLAHFTTAHFLVLNCAHRDRPVPKELQHALRVLLDQGLVERAGRGRVVLSRRLHAFLGRKGTYTRKVGLDRDTNKQLLLKHLHDNPAEGCRMEELMQVLPALSRDQVATLLRQMKVAGLAHPVGRTRAARWFPGPPASTVGG